jgi:GPH family glycoside/pentoside/hexuronide:cation symporter
MTRLKTLPYRAVVGWGLGTLPMAIYFNAFNVLALRFFTDFVGIAAASAGLLIGLSKLYDAFSDPLMGMLSDRTNSRFGRRRPYLLLGGLLCGVSLYVLFSTPAGMSGTTALWYVGCVLLLYATSYTIYNIPYMAMPAEITRDSRQRSSMMSWRVACIGAGGLIAGAFGPKVVAWAGGGVAGHSVMGMFLGGLIVSFSILTFFLTSDVPAFTPSTPKQRFTLRESLSTIFSNRPYLLLLGLKFFQLSGVAISAGTLAFFTVWILGRNYADLGTIILFTSVGQILGAALWLAVQRRIGSRYTFFASSFLFCAISLSWLLASADEVFAITLARVFLKGLGAGGILLVSQSLLPDTIEFDRLSTGLRREGVLSGVYTTIEKLAFAVGTALTGVYLGASGYLGMQNPVTGEQSAEAIRAIYYCQSVLPAALVAISALFIIRYRLDEKMLRALRTEADPND